MATNTTVIYVGDPLCSWCWGIANELEEFVKSHSYPLQVVMGGLRPGTTKTWTAEERSFIRHHWVEVNKRSGQPINFDLIDQETPFVYDTEVPCRAVVTVRSIDSSKAFRFFKSIQKGFYVNNQDTNKEEFYEPLIKDIGLDFNDFILKFRSEELRKSTNDDFMWCRNVGANSFPTVVLDHSSQLHAIAIGYATAEDMGARAKKITDQE